MLNALEFGSCTQAFRESLALDPRTNVGRSQREKRHEVQEGYQHVAVTTSLSKMHSLVTQRDYSIEALGPIPTVWNVENVAQHCGVSGQVFVLRAERDKPQDQINRNGEPIAVLWHDAELRKLSADFL